MKKRKTPLSSFLILYDKGISQKQKLIDVSVTLIAWLFWGWLSYNVIFSYINYGPAHFGSFLKVLLESLEVALVVATVLILFGIHNARLFFRDQKNSPDLGIELPLSKTASHFELDVASARIAREEKKVDVEVDEFGKVIKITKHQVASGHQPNKPID